MIAAIADHGLRAATGRHDGTGLPMKAGGALNVVIATWIFVSIFTEPSIMVVMVTAGILFAAAHMATSTMPFMVRFIVADTFIRVAMGALAAAMGHDIEAIGKISPILAAVAVAGGDAIRASKSGEK